jgi:hypothetical protein
MTTIRAYQNKECVATGRTMKDGRFYQVFPTKVYLTNEAAWRDSIQEQYSISFITDAAAAGRTYKYDKNTHHILPAGRYYIGDLCYAMKDTIYDSVFGDTAYSDGYYTTKDGDFLVAGTAYGDGAYKGSNNFEYGVDAGILGIASMGVCNPESDVSGGTFHTFTRPVECHFKNGYFAFYSGSFHLTINTR